MIDNTPINICSGSVSPKLKEKLYKKYPLTEDERECFRIIGSADGNLGERLVRIANEYFRIKEKSEKK